MKMEFEKIQEISALNILYDVYGELLPEKQREMFRLYYEDNYSLAEVGQELGMSRQGVHEAVKRAGAKLEGYEKKLGLAKKFGAMEEALQQAAETIDIIFKQSAEGQLCPEELDKALAQMREEIKTALGGLDSI